MIDGEGQALGQSDTEQDTIFGAPQGEQVFAKTDAPACKIKSVLIDYLSMTNKDVLLLTSPAATACLRGITNFAHAHGWFITIEDREHPPHDWRGDGVLATIGPNRTALVAFVRRVRRHGVPVVDLTCAMPNLHVPRVCGDNVTMGRLAAEHFRARGFRRAAWFSSQWSNLQRLRCQGLTENGFPDAVRLVGLRRPELARRLAALQKPVAVFAYSDNDASRVLNACRDAHIAVPEEVAILGVDNNELICLNQPTPLSSIRHDLERVGSEGAALLHRLMSSADAPRPQTVLIPPRGVAVRFSTQVEATDDPLLLRAFAFLRRNFGRETGSAQVADALGVSRIELDRAAQRALGRSFAEELRRQRLARAKVLLAETDLTLEAIASETGFCHAAHLANAIRTAFGTTARSLRREQARDAR